MIHYTETWRVLDRGWYTVGTNHREFVKRGVTWYSRDMTQEAWFIELPDLDALLALYAAEGSLVLQPHAQDDSLTEILIYDDYIE